MNFTRDEVDGKVVIRCEGRLDAISSPQLETALNKIVDEKRNKILIDFNKVDYLSSAGMRLLLSMTKRLKLAGGNLALFSLHDDVIEIIRMAGFEHILNIFSDEKHALSNHH